MRLLIVVTWAVCLITSWCLFPPKIVPSPFEVLSAFGTLWTDHDLGSELITSICLNLQSILYATFISLALSYATVLPVARPFVSLVTKFRFLGYTGLTFVFGLAVTGHDLKVWMLTFGMSVFFVTSMTSVVAAIPKGKFSHARTLRMGEWRVVYEVVVLGTIDQAFEVLRQNAAMGWMLLTMVEGLVRSEGGVGVLMLNENKHFKLGAVFAIQLTLLVVGLLQDTVIVFAKRQLCPYSFIKLERK